MNGKFNWISLNNIQTLKQELRDSEMLHNPDFSHILQWRQQNGKSYILKIHNVLPFSLDETRHPIFLDTNFSLQKASTWLLDPLTSWKIAIFPFWLLTEIYAWVTPERKSMWINTLALEVGKYEDSLAKISKE